MTFEQPQVLAQPSTVPYIAAWTRETPITPPVIPLALPGVGMGIQFVDEGPGDRDPYGVLWRRTAIVATDTRGRPEFGVVHPRRQRRCVFKNLCQVCGRPASRTERGYLWLIERPHGRTVEGEETTHPPLCLPCAETALRECPHLQKSAAMMRVQNPQPVGVLGTIYALDPRTGQYVIDRAEAAYADHRSASIIANQAIIRLSGCTPTDLQQELRQHGPLRPASP